MAYILCFYVFNYIALEISLIPKLLLAHMSFMKFRFFFVNHLIMANIFYTVLLKCLHIY